MGTQGHVMLGVAQDGPWPGQWASRDSGTEMAPEVTMDASHGQRKRTQVSQGTFAAYPISPHFLL